MVAAADLLERARKLYEERRFQESERAFRQLITSGQNAVEGHYGIGLIRLTSAMAVCHSDPARSQRELAAAVSHLEETLRRDARHANALYQLAFIAEQREEREEARSLYQRALSVNPDHAGARQRLAGMPGSPTDAEWRLTAATPPAAAPAAEREFGVYEFLLHDASPVSRQTIAEIAALRMKVRPTFTSYLGSFLSWSFVGTMPLLMLLTAPFIVGGRPVGALGMQEAFILLGGLLISLIGAIGIILKVCSTTLSVDKGRIQIATGVLGRRLVSVELWRVSDIRLDQTFLNRITRDGTLVFEVFHRKQPLRVTGLARGSRLPETYQGLLNLVFLLRSNPVVKGIIY